jgi:8-oxo-dGTP pyrophosphatase MutT (NUDIX family)
LFNTEEREFFDYFKIKYIKMIPDSFIHCSEGLKCPTNLNFIYQEGYIRRAGIIPYMIDDTNTTYILIGYSNEKNPVWADLGGRAETNETTIETALREYGEESRYVLSPDLNNIKYIVITGKEEKSKNPDQVLFLMEVDPTLYNININQAFLSTVPTTQYEDEMQFLRWVSLDDFVVMEGLTRSMVLVQNVIKTITTLL